MAVQIEVTPEQVAAAYPSAPAVTAEQIQQARDWAEPQLESAGILLAPDSRQERAARRAVMLYALHLASQFGGLAVRTDTKAQAGVIQERKKVGELEKDVKYASPGESASGFLATADGYLAEAWAALYAAGLPRPRLSAGASR
ncbi:DUF4054 domain-containing protein [Deinococcus radiophilus]|uniref:DUF4054 domain-containing protein n=2 Tax=Deinococcus radiophilus TaxID=32062 RepID=A0A3S0RIC8_9DEIO|nr:DUF4054 domain-containing protein [Deinococcus radiophilus]RTR29060.1 DUF4054 domain-containing protein [Deinococcus radiophilus]UFA49647.1 DUF4054 domain-containing protein [Deinococcus radiophilus]